MNSVFSFTHLFVFRFVLISLTGITTCSWGQQLSNEAQISLLTADPGTDLYAQFGHTAIRVYDPVSGTDVAYNYGVFDFDTPNFYVKFIRGKLNYMIAVEPTERFRRGYTYLQREVREQIFQLEPARVRSIAAFLQENYRPENRFYLYDFFFDNCATRIRDLFEKELNTTFSPATPKTETKTFRQLLDEYIEISPWNNFGIDFILGLVADQPAGFREEMFLPDYLSLNLSKVIYQGKPLTTTPTVIIPAPEPIRPKTLFTPWVVFGSIFIVFTLLTFWGSAKTLKKADQILFAILAFCGIFLLFMWIGTNHQATWRNMNMLWANPLFLFLLFLRNPWRNSLIILLLLLALINLIGFQRLPQEFNTANIPILLTIILRLGHHLWIYVAAVSSNRSEPLKLPR